MASTSGSLQPPSFTGKNYEYWSLTMKALFRGQDVWEIVQHGYAEPADMTAYNNLTQKSLVWLFHKKVYNDFPN